MTEYGVEQHEKAKGRHANKNEQNNKKKMNETNKKKKE